jgi:hypothetical protein
MLENRSHHEAFWPWLFYSLGYGLLFFFSYILITRWRFDFNADMALIGLIAKHILELGDRPIFVWGVGYQGMFLEGYLSALLFKIGGPTPEMLNLAPGIYFVLGTILWHITFAKIFGHGISSLALLLTSVCSLFYYRIMVRALPNFAAVHFLGSLLLFYVYHYCEHIRSRVHTSKKLRLVFAIGFICGFGFYIFPLFSIHIFALGTSLALMFLFTKLRQREITKKTQLQSLWLLIMHPAMWAKEPTKTRKWERQLSSKLMRLVVGIQLIGLIMIFLPEYSFMFQGRPIILRGLEFISHSTGVAVIIHAYFVIKYWVSWKQVTTWRSEIFIVLLGGIFGLSPKIYFHFVQGLRTRKGYSIRGSSEDISRRFGYMIDFLKDVFQTQIHGFLTPVLSLILVLACLIFAYKRIPIFLCVFAHKNPLKQNFFTSSIFECFLISYLVIMAAIFLFSNVAYSDYTMRFMILFIPIFTLMIAWALWRCVCSMSNFVCISLLSLLIVGVLLKANTLENEIVESDVLISDLVEKTMDDHDIKFAYGDYWAAYNTSFLSKERLIVQPIYSAYGSHYGPLIAEQNRVGYFVRRNEEFDLIGDGPFTIKNTLDHNRKIFQEILYHISATHIIDDQWVFYVLDKASIE